MRRWCIIAAFACCFRLLGAEVIPPAPAAYFNDYANVVSGSTAAQLNKTLEDFERQSSEQIVVAVFPKMQSDSSVEDYTVRVARAWQAGQKDKNNGAVLFVFIQDHKMFLQVGYGLEGALPDALCKRIIDEQIAPRFKAGDFDGGLTAGVQAIIAAARGEYQGTGQTFAGRHFGPNILDRIGDNIVALVPLLIFGAIVLLVVFSDMSRWRRGLVYSGGGWGGSGWSVGSWGGGAGFSGGGGFGGGGGFSGGGGSFGGGGAGGGW